MSASTTHGLAGPGVAARLSVHSSPALLRWIVPSFADVVFIILMYILAFSPVGLELFNDADTGWHIRTGEQILRTMSVPHVDPFSYTMNGRPWFAWEWLCDAVFGAAHAAMGLTGVRVLAATIIALTFSLLYRFLLRRTGDPLVSVVLTALAAAAAQVHMLARPHIATWLLTLAFVTVLYGARDRSRTRLAWIPALMLLWVNVHAGFLVGIAVVGIFLLAEAWDTLAANDTTLRRAGLARLRSLSAAGAACIVATFATPYGYGLHRHIMEYLRNGFIMSTNAEFQSPNFHDAGPRYFLTILLLAIATVCISRRKLHTMDVLLFCFGAAAGLYAVRNIPVAAILISVAIAPSLAYVVEDSASRGDLPRILTAGLQRLRNTSDRMRAVQQTLRGNVASAAVLAIACAAALGGGRIGHHQLAAASFSARKFPVGAMEKVIALDIRDGLFSIDKWGGYLIYRDPALKVFVDDRHDFYGEAFLRDFLQAGEAQAGWAEVLDKYRVRWALLPPEAPLARALRTSNTWTVAYEDGTAVLFGQR